MMLNNSSNWLLLRNTSKTKGGKTKENSSNFCPGIIKPKTSGPLYHNTFRKEKKKRHMGAGVMVQGSFFVFVFFPPR